MRLSQFDLIDYPASNSTDMHVAGKFDGNDLYLTNVTSNNRIFCV